MQFFILLGEDLFPELLQVFVLMPSGSEQKTLEVSAESFDKPLPRQPVSQALALGKYCPPFLEEFLRALLPAL
jgi:hypothetical protein